MLLLVLIWTVWTTSVYDYVDKEGKKVSESKTETVVDPKNRFPTRDQCFAEIDKQLGWMEQQGVTKRVGRFETANSAGPVQWTTRWECREEK